MKIKTKSVLALLFLSCFVKSFIFPSNAFDIVFIILITAIYALQDFLTEQKTIKDIDKLTADINTRLNRQDEAISTVRDTNSKMALMNGIRR